MPFYSELLYFEYNFVREYYNEILEDIRDFYYNSEGERYSFKNAVELKERIKSNSFGGKR